MFHNAPGTHPKLSLLASAICATTCLLVSPLSLARPNPSGGITPEVLAQLQALSERVSQLEAQLAQQKAQTPEALVKKVETLEKKLAVAEQENRAARAKMPVITAGEKGFGLKSADGEFEVKIKGLVQADARLFDAGVKGRHPYLGDSDQNQLAADAAAAEADDNFLMRRVRPTIEGTLYGIYGFRFTPEYGNNSTTILDAYVEAKLDEALVLRAGKFTPPLGLERLQSSSDNKFNELSLVSTLIPSRDIGFQLGGDLWTKTVSYRVGIFNGAADGATGDTDSNTDKELQARVFAQPWVNDKASALQGLGFGIAASEVDASGGSAAPTAASGLTASATELPSYKSIGQETFFAYRSDTDQTSTTYADGRRSRLIPQFHYFYHNLGLLGEYAMETQDVTRVNGATVRNDALDIDAWQLTAAWTITGEEQSFKGIVPEQNFKLDGKGWGAWELVLRYSEWNMDDAAFEIDGALPAKADASYNNSYAEATKSVKSAENWGLGLNWYLNRNLRVSLDYDQTNFQWGGGGTSTAPKDRDDERVFIGRMQASF